MPVLTDFATINTIGLSIRELKWAGQVLSVDYGAGYGDDVLVGSTWGLYGWKIGFGVLPDNSSLMISSQTWFDYYFGFFQSHTTGTTRVFVLPWRSQSWTGVFAAPDLDFQRFKSEIYTGELEVKYRRVPGLAYNSNGSAT